ncbi:unnamed protein product [Fusarium equiseti]|uniref:FAD-binding PCMH-type domain-containing protein n=1 Tax=Fusarium equiseti TaxID=61235 RepID=A0A8J2IHT6_FUSEQ|nr:unnamed protein product [Fusarium equiseti]
MAPQIIRLPDGQTFTVTPVFAGLGFKSHELNTHHNAFPLGWTVVLNTETDCASDDDSAEESENGAALDGTKRHIHSFRKPTLQGDNLFISSIANPSNSEFKPAASPTRQIAMMLWITLYWYFHQPEPEPQMSAQAAEKTPQAGKPRGEWKINIKRDGVLRGRNLIPKLERMGLITSGRSAVGTSLDDNGDDWAHMFVSKRMFWQIPGRLFLFSLQPNKSGGAYDSVPGSPIGSRPNSPLPMEPSSPFHKTFQRHSPHSSLNRIDHDLPGGPTPTSMTTPPSFPIGPFYSSSHLPTYYPPPPLQYIFTNNIRHPTRPKPPRMGEVFYTRFVPSVNQYLSFRVASISPNPVPYLGPVGPTPPEQSHLSSMNDTSLLQMWMNKPRVSEFWGEYEDKFLTNALNQPNCFPVIGLWDGVPFGYFEVYWVKEDILGKHIGSDADDWDRGIHVFIGEEWARGRVPIWLTGLVHWCLTSDYRTMSVCLEPRVDNARFLQGLERTGFSREKQVSFPHKQSWLVRMRRKMCQPAERPKTNHNSLFIRQNYLRGQLGPAFQPPSKTCPRCKQSYTSIRNMCLPCLKLTAAENDRDSTDRKRDTFVEHCHDCNETTVHLGPHWCTTCWTLSKDTYPAYCEDCVVQIDVPTVVGDDKDSDIQAAIKTAKENDLTILAAGGTHGTFVTVDASTLYLDMTNFKTIELNKDNETVRVGGGVITGEVVKALAEEGYYTPVPNSDAVGFVGCILGGGNGVLSGLHGWMVDNVVSFRIITVDGTIVNVSSESQGEELELFNTLCGAGHGLGVITEVTVSIFPIAKLNMENDKIWTRTFIFPAAEIDIAIKTFLDLQHPSPEGFATMVFARNAHGAPIIVLGYTFFGPADKAEKDAAVLFQKAIASKVIVGATEYLPFVSLNAKNEVYNSHGGHKAIASCRLTKTTASALRTSFDLWCAATQDHPDASQTPLIISACNTSKSETFSNSSVEARDRPLNAFAPVLAKTEEGSKALTEDLDKIIGGLREADEGAEPRSFANNWRFETDIGEMFSEKVFERVRKVKGVWDERGLFWSPYFKNKSS